jgi:hypothetical protein
MDGSAGKASRDPFQVPYLLNPGNGGHLWVGVAGGQRRGKSDRGEYRSKTVYGRKHMVDTTFVTRDQIQDPSPKPD